MITRWPGCRADAVRPLVDMMALAGTPERLERLRTVSPDAAVTSVPPSALQLPRPEAMPGDVILGEAGRLPVAATGRAARGIGAGAASAMS